MESGAALGYVAIGGIGQRGSVEGAGLRGIRIISLQPLGGLGVGRGMGGGGEVFAAEDDLAGGGGPLEDDA